MNDDPTLRRAPTSMVEAINFTRLFCNLSEDTAPSFHFMSEDSRYRLAESVSYLVRALPASGIDAKMSDGAASLLTAIVDFFAAKRLGASVFLKVAWMQELREFARVHAHSIDQQIAADPSVKARMAAEHWGPDAPNAGLTSKLIEGDAAACRIVREFIGRYS
jgi:hypothetical protein